MKLFVLRHADAETEAASDDERALSEKGRDQAARAGSFCQACALFPEVILHSPLRRARETAEIFGKTVELPRLIEVAWLACGMTSSSALENLADYAEFASVLIVGHEPDLSGLIASCLGLEEASALHIRKSSLTCLELRGFSAGTARLEALVPAKLMRS